MTSQLLQIFAKRPVGGKVKTRLATDIGDAEACRAYEELLLNTLAVSSSHQWARDLWCEADANHDFFLSLADKFNLALHQQQGIGLGERMLLAFQEGLMKAEKVVLVGTDCPVLSVSYIRRAFEQLEGNDVVFGPAEDGGYVLIGCRKSHVEMFKAVNWSAPSALVDSITAVSHCGLSHGILDVLWDVDDLTDFQRWKGLEHGD
jgi:hypothetical protein